MAGPRGRRAPKRSIRPYEPEPVRADNLAEQACGTLRRLILERRMPPGSPVVEGRLAEELGISRTPMREALVRLVGERLLERADVRSYSVRRVTPTEFFQSMKVREILEVQAMELAAGKVACEEIDALIRDIRRLASRSEQEAAHWQADDRLHLMFATASGNAVLARTIDGLRINTRLFEISSVMGRVEKDCAEHLAILEAWRGGDVKAAQNALCIHLGNLQHEALEVVAGRRAA